ncbi:MFS transporter [Calothrix sp. UHCC 0171]|uniref:MFS transporter n=1 Tax=Calothrix sp. UHCC 0171 TaxID=3110245 RepID=UPI002B1EEBEA|nr:MFS transporter [Calothrix sp. UHCC 0171]MEA5574017.1 MFS transporter [Calothrix sp. UHCC 0171]
MIQPLTVKNMQTFILVWLGQVASLTGSGLTNFALGVWVYQDTGSVTQFALISLFATIPRVIISPVAGAVVDRWQRRWVMIIADSGAGISTLLLFLLLLTNHLEIWHIYLVTITSASFSAFQWPAYNAATTLIVPKKFLSRANGMIELGEALPQLISPVLAGVLLINIQLQGIILIDFISFIFSFLILINIHFPDDKRSMNKKIGNSSLFTEMIYGCKYVFKRKGLLGLLIFSAVTDLGLGVVQVLITPLVLSFASPTALGSIMSIGGIGMLLGSLLIIIHRGAKQKINSIFIFQFLGGLSILAAGLKTSVILSALAAFLFFFTWTIINSSTRFILQKKVSHDVQGRVFALIGGVTGISFPIAYLVAGPLADKIFEPLMSANGLLAGSMGKIIGIGTGRGIGLMFILMGLITMLITICGYYYPPLRKVEIELPDVA